MKALFAVFVFFVLAACAFYNSAYRDSNSLAESQQPQLHSKKKSCIFKVAIFLLLLFSAVMPFYVGIIVAKIYFTGNQDFLGIGSFFTACFGALLGLIFSLAGYRIACHASKKRGLKNLAISSLASPIAVFVVVYIIVVGFDVFKRPLLNGRHYKSMMTFHVKDSLGRNVSDARFNTNFHKSIFSKSTINGYTDDNGVFVAKGRVSNSAFYTVKKDGYYETTGKHTFDVKKGDYYKDGRWLPWNPTLEITLKEKRNLVDMIRGRIETKFPAEGEPFGFDVFKQDWVAPHGKGEIVDFSLTYNGTPKSEPDWDFNLTLEFNNGGDGAYVSPMDTYSQLTSEYEVDASKLEPKLFWNYERDNDRIVRDNRLGTHNWVYFRVRSKTNKLGETIGGFYGKVCGMEFVTAGKDAIRFWYFLNPNEGDKIIETESEHP